MMTGQHGNTNHATANDPSDLILTNHAWNVVSIGNIIKTFLFILDIIATFILTIIKLIFILSTDVFNRSHRLLSWSHWRLAPATQIASNLLMMIIATFLLTLVVSLVHDRVCLLTTFSETSYIILRLLARSIRHSNIASGSSSMV